ncbi:hypothetical protein AALO_G00057620 [Alosa alosa]|uniref:Uncharacterized protein n=1 Tax=Alosa alosa TaxID=278164 RepID=A0AAV6H617_9TELE|nr:hypothetical protein AALO_G00057620 [Alosa alosa]
MTPRTPAPAVLQRSKRLPVFVEIPSRLSSSLEQASAIAQQFDQATASSLEHSGSGSSSGSSLSHQLPLPVTSSGAVSAYLSSSAYRAYLSSILASVTQAEDQLHVPASFPQHQQAQTCRCSTMVHGLDHQNSNQQLLCL